MAPEDLIIVVGIALSAFLLFGCISGYLVYEMRFSPRARLRKRVASVVNPGSGSVASVADRGDGRRRKQVKAKLKTIEEEQHKKSQRRRQVRQQMLEAGFATRVREFYLLCAIVALVAAGVYLLSGFWWWGVFLVAPPVGYFLPRFVLGHLAKRRKKKFTSQFADALDVIVRGVKSGLPTSECLRVIADESPEPMAGEFRLLTESQNLGLTLDDAMGRALERMPTPELKFFAIVMNIQQQTGGNLAETLTNLTTVLRDRKKMRDKITAVSAEARWTALIIGSLPFVVCGALFATNPEYVSLLFTDTLGNILLGVGIAMMTTGALIMKQMINFEI